MIRSLPRWRLTLPVGCDEVVIRDGELVSDIYPVKGEVPGHFAPLFGNRRPEFTRLVQRFR
jgi:hypothetical protein